MTGEGVAALYGSKVWGNSPEGVEQLPPQYQELLLPSNFKISPQNIFILTGT